MNLVVQADLKAYIDPLTPDEHDALERSLLKEGCRDALVLWGDLLIDGHNRYAICQKHGLPFQTVQSKLFKTLDDVHLWMIEQHLGRRSVSDFQRGVLALRKREILAARKALVPEPEAASESDSVHSHAPSIAANDSLRTRDDIAKAARLSSSQVVLIEKIQKQAAPELVAAVKSGSISINAAAAVASLPETEQREAASGGTEVLRQAAKRVRDAKRRVREDQDSAPEPSDKPQDQIRSLQARVAALEAENADLKARLAQLAA
ncbi:MAG: plasmid replication/partition related protein [Burkholderiales bacterium PBB4]|nr:MAG: plasmid replication/partition related protein [Burkholderiales bacterium PBB4]